MTAQGSWILKVVQSSLTTPGSGRHDSICVLSPEGAAQRLGAAVHPWVKAVPQCWSHPTTCNTNSRVHGFVIFQWYATRWNAQSSYSYFMLCGFNIRWRSLREGSMFVASLVMLACHLRAAADIRSGRQPSWYMKCGEASKGRVIEETAPSCYHENIT